jgi:diguanylate cyclase (GGDEF)-like protein
MAFYDKLTGLPNRQLLLDRLSTRWRWAGALAVLAPPVHRSDHFKSINDTRGMTRATSLLQQVADRLAVRSCDTVARFGGDEFVVLLEDLGADAERAREIASKLLQAFQAPFEVAGTEHYSTPSIGVALFGRETAEHRGSIEARRPGHVSGQGGGPQRHLLSRSGDAVAGIGTRCAGG